MEKISKTLIQQKFQIPLDDTSAAWIESNHYQIVGVNREIYWQPGFDQGGFIEAGNEFIVEVQFPVQSLKA